tara:strand:- start:8027 stop:8287 length:261 start_codon:yes stop_codon:yes gene_type:complete
MNNKIKKSGIMLAAAAAFAFTMAPSVVSANTEKHNAKCFGVNACKGKSSCKTSKSSCKAHNSCKGKGFVMVSKKACQQMGGEVKSK